MTVFWYPEAEKFKGPDWKSGGHLTPKAITAHSMVGWKGGAHDVLLGRREASWHISFYQDGSVEQHYPFNIRTWHGHGSNAFAIGAEHEGGFDPEDEPLTPIQLEQSIKFVKWASSEYDFPLIRNGLGYPNETLLEHNQYANKPCPSNRIPWDKYVEDNMTNTDKLWVENLINEAIRVQVKNELVTPILDMIKALTDRVARLEPASPIKQYRVQRGDNLNKIALHFGTTVEDLIRANNLPNPDQISVDQILVIV